MCQVAVAGSSLFLDLKATFSQRNDGGREASKRALKWNAGAFGMDRRATTAVLQMGKSV